MFKSLARSQRARRLLGTTRFVVLSNFLRSGIVDFLESRPGRAASLDEIVDYYFGTLEPSERGAIDEHLVRCHGCIKSYVAYKRAIEDEAGLHLRPSPATHDRLLRSVRQAFPGPKPRPRLAALFALRLPLYQSLLLGTAMALLFLLMQWTWGQVAQTTPRAELVTIEKNTSRDVSQSLTIF